MRSVRVTFKGVATVVLKLFNLVRPTRAYFGQKDAQQVDVIQQMVLDLNVPVKIVVVPIVRDFDGVALSSRNVYLSPKERKIAVEFARLLQHAVRHELEAAIWLGEQLSKIRGLKLDYMRYAGGRLVVAVKIGKTRLLDNERITVPCFQEGFAVRSLAGNTASQAFIWLKGKENAEGEFEGTCNITGSPIKPRADARKLLTTLRRDYKGRGKCRMVVLGPYREFQLTYPGKTPLLARVKMKKKGDSVGPLYAGPKQIGTVVIPEDEMTPEERRRRKRYRPPPFIRF